MFGTAFGAEVGANGEGGYSERPHLFDGPFVGVPAYDGEGDTLCGERQRYGASDPGRTSGDERRLACQIAFHYPALPRETQLD